MHFLRLFCTYISVTIVVKQCLALDHQRKQSITTVLNAKWSSTPFALEISEFLNDIKSDYFWEYLEYLSENEIVEGKFTDKEYYDKLIEFSSRYLTVTKLNLLKFSLALREYSPKIEMYQHLALDRGVGKMNCDAVFEFRGKLGCEENFSIESAGEESAPKIFDLDHLYPHQDPLSEIVILYGEVGSKSFQRMHRKLAKMASEGRVKYIFRHFLSNRSLHKTRLSGYGVELQIKSSEYKAQDDRELKATDGENEELGGNEAAEKDIKGFVFSKLVENHPKDKEKLLELKQHLIDQSNNMAPLKVWELQDLSMQAAAQILSNSKLEQLNALEEISQNFPSHARTLSRTKIPKDMKKEIKKNSDQFYGNHGITPKDAMLFINGMQYDMEYVDIFTLLDVVKSESSILDGLGKLGLKEENAAKMLSIDFSKKDSEKFGVDIRSSAVHWINNIEKDKLYKGWPSSVQELLRPTFPGMLRSIRKNFFNVILVCDPSNKESIEMIKTLESFYVHRAPTRIGLVFKINSDPSATGEHDVGVALHNAFNFISTDKDPADALSFITDVYSKVEEDEQITLKLVKEVFMESHGSDVKMDDVFGSDSEYDYGRQLAQDFIEKSGLKEPKISVLMNGIPFDESKLNSEDFEDEIMMEIMRITQDFQRDVYKGLVTDSTNLLEYLMEKENILPSLNERIIKADTYIDLIGDVSSTLDLDAFSLLDRSSMASTIAEEMKYLSLKEPSVGQFNVLTAWLVADLETDHGRDMLKGGIAQVKSSAHMRLGIIHNIKEQPGVVSLAIQAAVETQTSKAAKTLINKILNPKTVKALKNGEKSVFDYDIPDADMEKLKVRYNELKHNSELFEAHKLFAKTLPNFEPGESRGVLLNGLVIGPLNKEEKFDGDDFHLLEKFAHSRYGEKLTTAFYNSMNVRSATDNKISDKAMKIVTLLINRPESDGKKSRQEIVFYGDKHSAITLEPNYPDQPAFDIVAIADPTTLGAQKMSSVLRVLQKVTNSKIKVFLNCVDKHSEMPQKSYFSMVLDPELYFTEDGNLSLGPHARFADLPKEPIFTMHHHIPDNWLIEPVKSVYDLDNIKLENIEGNVNSEFELENLLLEGHCFETGTGNPPRGLQMTLGTKQEPVVMDTIVMANLGYLQLKSNPGRWFLQLREGRSSEIYDITSHENTEGGENDKDIQVLITSFKSKIVKLKVSKKPEKRNEELLTSDTKNSNEGSLWNSITSTLAGGTKESAKSADGDEDILNIFCLASGHLYERLLKIMMLTTMRTTTAKKVKFWILKNYLSPSLKEVLPAFAKEYGFEFEYVQYKWPRWLNQQSQKQRIIWGYKILFLDVLFPLDVKKIIFVDTDQIVQSDLKELRDLDLEGAPYGYTPFCDSNKEMDGFRFWNSGYWKNHLAGRKYHISALYVIDLVKFRQIAAGDRLRGQYQALSQDPNSLANLDQDLPNNMIHQVPIKSLPQEWLWCETWCDQSSKAKAKNIDLCNNPLTKESKLDAARRIVKEWTSYDEEIHSFIEKLKTNDAFERNNDKTIPSIHDAHTEL